MNVDHGIMPACSTKIQEELNLDKTQFGILGSVDYFGQTLGSALATALLNSCPPKYVLIFCLVCNLATLLLFTFTDIYPVLIVCRGFTGLF